jgi:hypothetical protein
MQKHPPRCASPNDGVTSRKVGGCRNLVELERLVGDKFKNYGNLLLKAGFDIVFY